MPKLLSALLGVLLAAPAFADGEVNVYSYRQEALIKPFLDRFSAATGVRVNLVTGNADALLKRLESEGRNSPADLLITTDAGRLYRAKEAGVLQPVSSPALETAVPAHLRDADGHWWGLSKRARVIVYGKERVAPGEVSRYEDLTDARWRGRVCIRSSGNIYNQSLLAAMIAVKGEQQATDWAKGMVANFARPPSGNDRSQIKAVAAGQCDVAVVNNYYLGIMQTDTSGDGQREAAAKVGLVYPSLASKGTHVNVSGAGVTRHAPNRDNAVRLLEFLLSDAEQRNYARDNHEYPVKPGIAVSELIRGWGGYPFAELTLPMEELGRNNARAVMIFDRVGWR